LNRNSKSYHAPPPIPKKPKILNIFNRFSSVHPSKNVAALIDHGTFMERRNTISQNLKMVTPEKVYFTPIPDNPFDDQHEDKENFANNHFENPFDSPKLKRKSSDLLQGRGEEEFREESQEYDYERDRSTATCSSISVYEDASIKSIPSMLCLYQKEEQPNFVKRLFRRVKSALVKKKPQEMALFDDANLGEARYFESEDMNPKDVGNIYTTRCSPVPQIYSDSYVDYRNSSLPSSNNSSSSFLPLSNEKMRHDTCLELLITEEAYLRDMENVLNVK
jgi:hypothetical protein